MTINDISNNLVKYIEDNRFKNKIDYFYSIDALKELLKGVEKEYQDIEERFIDEQYNIMKNWVFNVDEKELDEHYEWYGVEKGDKEDLLNTMFESYCNNYDNIELEKRIESFKEV